MFTINFSTADKKRGYTIKGDQIIFIFNKNLYNDEQLKEITINQVGVTGSFTAWKKAWPLNRESNNIWTLETDLTKVNIPGNCGQPEFRFVVNDQYKLDAAEELSINKKFYDDHGSGYKNIILFTDNNLAKIKEINQKIEKYKTTYSSNKELANFREITLGNIAPQVLYRSYHPFKKSRPDHPLEDKRISVVQRLIEDYKINSIINLSDINTNIPANLDYYKKINQQGNMIFTNKGYNYDVFYYIADSDNFAQLINRVIKFIIETEAPYLIHCRIGTDRTGVIVAILAAFMGAKWKEIIKDYQRSNKLGIGEYRDEDLLKYAFTKLLDTKQIPTDLEAQITDYLKSRANLSTTKLNKLKSKLKNSPSS